MDNKIDEILQRYPLKVMSGKRIRGAFMLYAEGGTYIVKIYEGSQKRLKFQKLVQDKLSENGYELTDLLMENVDGELSSRDSRGNVWIVKKWYYGEECDIKNIRSVCLAAANMAKIHKLMVIDEEYPEIFYEKKDLNDIFAKHNREIKRVYTYIKDKRQKNEMEIKLLNSYNIFYEQGEAAARLLKCSGYEKVRDDAFQNKRVLHNNYTYHNIIFSEGKIVTTGFDKCEVGVQIFDLYDFIRKIMEKNLWKIDIGLKVIDAYCNERRPSMEECRILYTLLTYPEKYWKLVNFYYNSRKTWISSRNYEKLNKICEQECGRMEFLSSVKKLLF